MTDVNLLNKIPKRNLVYVYIYIYIYRADLGASSHTIRKGKKLT